MRQLSKWETRVLLAGGLLMVVGSGAYVLLQAWAPYLFVVGAILFVAMQMRQRLAKIGIDAEATADTTLMIDFEDICGPDDCVCVFTIADNGGIYNPIITTISENRCPVFCFTMSQALPFKKKCEQYVVLPRISRDSSISFLDDQAVFMVFIEILMNRIAAVMSK